MAPGKRTWRPTLSGSYWAETEGAYRADRTGLVSAADSTGRTADELRAMMGHGWRIYLRALEGQPLTLREAWFVDALLLPERELPPRHST